jgi:two-component system phosphate regulon sensor histidine kinase PhoR
MQRSKRLFWQIYSYFLIVTLGALAATAWYAEHSLRQFHLRKTATELETRAQLFSNDLPPTLASDPAAVDRLCKHLGRLTMTRMTVVLPDGHVIGDSDENPALMENHRDRQEIATALKGTSCESVRYSQTLARTLMYVAVPVRHDGAVIAVVRTALPLTVIDAALPTFHRHVAWGTLGVAGVFALLALGLFRRISRPIEHMRQMSEQLALGDLAARVPVPDTEELGALARTMNQMAAQLKERILTVASQSNEQRAVLANMIEGVMAVDTAQRILHINPAASRLLGIVAEDARGRHILEAVRNIDLQEFLAELLDAPGSLEREIVLRDDVDRHIQLNGTALKDGVGNIIGTVVVLNDITRLKRLESLRRDFIANVSHELKTPITTLKGCVETLSQGALDNPADAGRFLEMMGRQVDRLELMVEDLLSLSRLEHESEHGGVALTPGPIHDVLARAVQTFSARAESKGMLLVMDCPDALTAPLNVALLEQAVGNLLDNAIKYSPGETRISVTAAADGNQVEIRVADQGPGIEKQHHERIFERFYRVDPARSRSQGGTGLGLAIVKHIVLAHHGRIAIESTPGQGSTFILRLPRTARSEPQRG